MSDFPYRENGHRWRMVQRPLVGETIEQCDFCGRTRRVGEQLAACEVGPGARPVFGVTPPPEPRRVGPGSRPVFGVTPPPKARKAMSWKERQYR